MSELMFRSATELAELVRSGECSATALVEESLSRIDELQPTINAFTHVARESALATAPEIEPGDPRPSPACRSRSRTTAPSTACR